MDRSLAGTTSQVQQISNTEELFPANESTFEYYRNSKEKKFYLMLWSYVVKFRLMIKYHYTPAKPQRGIKTPAGTDLLQQTVMRSSGCRRPAVPPKSLSKGKGIEGSKGQN